MLCTCLAALALLASQPTDHMAIADRLSGRFDPLWNESEGRYHVTGGGVETTSNANLLLTHAVAAMEGHHGPARQDHRARVLVRSLLSSPPYAATLPPRPDLNSQWHAPGWVSSMSVLRAGQHVMIDAEVVDGLVHAWLARRQLGLPDTWSRRIADRIHAVARGRFWRWPKIRLNQFNWYARIYSADAIVTGDRRLVRRDLRLQLARFVRDVGGGARRAGNLGPGLRFHYFPDHTRRVRENFDSPEYANMVAAFTRFYRGAAGRRGLLRQWLRRVVTGYWTHSGYLNWDTGLGFRRWHQAKKLGLAQHGLIGIASARGLADARTRAWAKWILDRGFAFYERQTLRAGGLAPGVFFGLTVKPQSEGSARLAAARMAGNAARAVAAGLDRARAIEPPPLYSYDPDTGRLAVTTRFYNTAVVPVSQRAFPYGGIELARLYDGRQEVAASIGGRPPASFGVVVRGVLSSQLPRHELGATAPPLRLLHAPMGTRASLSARRAYAGPFRDLQATGVVRSGSLSVRTRHRFTERFVETRWSIRRLAGRPADVLFPSWGGAARITAVRRDGTRVPVTRRRMRLRGVAYLHVQSARSGYVVVPRRWPSGASVRALRTRRQSSAPRPGPTAAIAIGRRDGVAMAARVATVPDVDRAAEVAAQLRE